MGVNIIYDDIAEVLCRLSVNLANCYPIFLKNQFLRLFF